MTRKAKERQLSDIDFHYFSGCAYNEDIKPIWYCLDDHVKFPGIRYPQNLECVIMCSERREDDEDDENY